jgi:uncharacterized protein YycO
MENGKFQLILISKEALVRPTSSLKTFKTKLFVGVFLLICITVVVIFIKQKRQNIISNDVHYERYIQESEILSFLNDGDIICRLGDRIWSILFKDLSPNDKRFSHSGIIRIRDDVVSVIHTEGSGVEERDGVNEIPLRDFLQVAQSVGIYRLLDIEGEKISDTALEYIGRPFDWQFDMEDDNELYCTELVYVVLKKINPYISLNLVWIKEIGKNIIPLDIYSQSEYFVEIGYWRRNIN